jgi:hypothetical protein
MLRAYPSLTTAEFTQACLALAALCHDRLDGTSWKSVRWTGQELQIKQARPFTSESSGCPEAREADQRSEEFDVDDSNLEPDDGELVVGPHTSHQSADIDTPIQRVVPASNSAMTEIPFSITLSPTYSVPVLWFNASAITSPQTLHQTLVPPHLQEAIRAVGVMGGISQAVCLSALLMPQLTFDSTIP